MTPSSELMESPERKKKRLEQSMIPWLEREIPKWRCLEKRQSVWTPDGSINIRLTILVRSYREAGARRGGVVAKEEIFRSFWWNYRCHDLDVLAALCIGCIVTNSGNKRYWPWYTTLFVQHTTDDTLMGLIFMTTSDHYRSTGYLASQGWLL